MGVRDSKIFRACGAEEPQNSDYPNYYTIFCISLSLQAPQAKILTFRDSNNTLVWVDSKVFLVILATVTVPSIGSTILLSPGRRTKYKSIPRTQMTEPGTGDILLSPGRSQGHR